LAVAIQHEESSCEADSSNRNVIYKLQDLSAHLECKRARQAQ
jgi:hypothetical protein